MCVSVPLQVSQSISSVIYYNIAVCSRAFCPHSVYSRNSSPGGTVGIGFISVKFTGFSIFEYNIGPGLRVCFSHRPYLFFIDNTPTQIVGSLVGILPDAKLSFVGNNAENHEGGALYVQDFGQIKIYSNSTIEFINNTGGCV